jgi:hypothetical protein
MDILLKAIKLKKVDSGENNIPMTQKGVDSNGGFQ